MSCLDVVAGSRDVFLAALTLFNCEFCHTTSYRLGASSGTAAQTKPSVSSSFPARQQYAFMPSFIQVALKASGELISPLAMERISFTIPIR